MDASARSRRPSPQPSRLAGPRRLKLLALLLIPLLLVLHGPVLAALVPGALWTVASFEAASHEREALAPSAQVVGADDLQDLRRIAAATPIPAKTRRVG